MIDSEKVNKKSQKQINFNYYSSLLEKDAKSPKVFSNMKHGSYLKSSFKAENQDSRIT